MTAESSPKYYTVEEANRTLPLVKVIVGDIVTLFASVHDRRERIDSIRRRPGAGEHRDDSPYGEELRQIEEEIDKDIERVQEFVDELRSLHVELKDPVAGLIDFRTMIDGREAYLCWKLGEEEIGFWHELDAGFSGRQPLLANSIAGESEATDESR